MKRRILLLASVAAALSSAASASTILPFPSGTQAQVQTQVSADPSISAKDQITLGTSASAVDSTASATASTSIDLTTGILRAAAQGTTNPFAGSEGFEFLQFNLGGRSSANIQYAFNIDGSIFNTDPKGLADAGSSFTVYDVTGLTNFFQTFNAAGPNQPPAIVEYVPDGVPLISSNSTTSFVYGSQFDVGQIGPGGTQKFFQSQSGVPIPISYSQSGSFQVLPSHVYLVDLDLTTAISGGFTGNQPDGLLAGANFSNTAAFRFTDLDGTTVVSSSGSFLAASSTPEPASWALMLIAALAAVPAHRYKRACGLA